MSAATQHRRSDAATQSRQSATASISHKDLLDNLFDAVYATDRDRCILYWNRSAEDLTGFPAREVVGRHCADNILNHVDDAGIILCTAGCPMAATIDDGQVREANVFLHHKNGHRIPVTVRATAVRNEQGVIVGAVEVFTDRSPEIAAMEKIGELEQAALHCPLTAVANRRFTEMHLNSLIAEYERYDWPFGVLFVDVDHFKALNDLYGHNAGDDALRMVSRTLQGNLRSCDFIGRWGGEEFVIFLPNISPEGLALVAERCRALVERSFSRKGSGELRVTVSIGATLIQPGDSSQALVDRADRLMYESKEAGRNRVTMG